MGPDEGHEEYEEVQADLRKKEEEVTCLDSYALLALHVVIRPETMPCR